MASNSKFTLHLESEEVEAKALSKMLNSMSGVIENNSKKSFTTIKAINCGSIGFDVSIHDESNGTLLRYNGANVLYGIIKNIQDKQHDDLLNFKSKILKIKIVRFIESILLLNTIVRCDKESNDSVIVEPELISSAFKKVSHIVHKEEKIEIIEGAICGFNINTRTQEIFVISHGKTTKIKINQSIQQVLASEGCKINHHIKIEVFKKENSNTAKAIRLVNLHPTLI